MAPSYHSSSGRDPGEGALVTGLLDPLQLGLHAIQRARRVVVLVARMGEMAADHVEGVAELVEVAAQTGEPRLDVLRAPLDLQPLEPEDDHAQVGVQAVGGDGNHAPGGRVDGGRVLVDGVVPEDGFEVDVLGGDVPESEVIRAPVGAGGTPWDLVPPGLYRSGERPLPPAARRPPR